MKWIVAILGLTPWEDEEVVATEETVTEEKVEESGEERAEREANEAEQRLENANIGHEITYGTEEEEFAKTTPEVEEVEEEKEEEAPVVEEEEEEVTPVAEEAPVEEPKQPQVSDDQVFEALANAKAGAYDEGKNESIQRTAVGIVNEMSSKQLLSVIDKASGNGYGENSTDILVEAKSALTVSLAREQQQHKADQEKQDLVNQHQTKVNDSLTKTVELYPDLADENTEFSKYLLTWREKNIVKLDAKGNVTKEGPLYGLLQKPDWPVHVARLAHESFLGSSANSMKKELEQRKKKQNEETTSVASSTSSGSAGSEQKDGVDAEADELESKLKSMGNMR